MDASSGVATISLRAGDQGELVKPLSPMILRALCYYKYGQEDAAFRSITPFYTTPKNANALQRMAYMIGTRDLSSLVVEITTEADVSEISRCEIWGERLIGGEFDNMGLGRHMRLSRETIATTGVGEKSFDNIPYINGAGVRLMTLYAMLGDGEIARSKVEINERPEHFTPTLMHNHVQTIHGRNSELSYFSAIDFSLDDNPTAGLSLAGVSRLNFTADWSEDPGGAHDIILETVHGIDEASGI